MKQLSNKIIASLLLILATFAISGCTITNHNSGMIFSNKPIVGENFQNMTILKARERVYFGIFTKKGFKDDIIQYQLLKKDEKTNVNGYKIVYSRRAEVKHEHYFTDYVVPQEAGTYYIQVFELKNLHSPIVVGVFKACD